MKYKTKLILTKSFIKNRKKLHIGIQVFSKFLDYKLFLEFIAFLFSNKKIKH